MRTFKKGGIHPNPSKRTSEIPIQDFIPESKTLTLLLSQSIGAPSVALKKPGDRVEAGEKIADAGGFVGAPIHSPVSGTVKKIDLVKNPQGLNSQAMIIEADSIEMPLPAANSRSAEEVDSLTPEEIVAIVGDAGIVGLGGATFPTRVKLTVPKGKTIDTVLINGAECEPVLTCDDRLMRENPREIILGSLLIRKAVNAKRVLIGIEANKPKAIAAMKKAASEFTFVEIVPLRTRYPQGGEKQLIQALVGRTVPEGGLPADASVVVDNVATAYAIWDAAYNRRPLTHRVITVDGPSSRQGNWRVPIGISINELFNLDELKSEAEEAKLIAGGPMMGRTVTSPEAPVTKGFSGLVVRTKDIKRKPMGPCIRCNRCVEACPMGLEPYLLMLLALNEKWAESSNHHTLSCVECGSCSYICPANRPILDYIRESKKFIRTIKTKK